jgi:hypothetical protein
MADLTTLTSWAQLFTDIHANQKVKDMNVKNQDDTEATKDQLATFIEDLGKSKGKTVDDIAKQFADTPINGIAKLFSISVLQAQELTSALTIYNNYDAITGWGAKQQDFQDLSQQGEVSTDELSQKSPTNPGNLPSAGPLAYSYGEDPP